MCHGTSVRHGGFYPRILVLRMGGFQVVFFIISVALRYKDEHKTYVLTKHKVSRHVETKKVRRKHPQAFMIGTEDGAALRGPNKQTHG